MSNESALDHQSFIRACGIEVFSRYYRLKLIDNGEAMVSDAFISNVCYDRALTPEHVLGVAQAGTFKESLIGCIRSEFKLSEDDVLAVRILRFSSSENACRLDDLFPTSINEANLRLKVMIERRITQSVDSSLGGLLSLCGSDGAASITISSMHATWPPEKKAVIHPLTSAAGDRLRLSVVGACYESSQLVQRVESPPNSGKLTSKSSALQLLYTLLLYSPDAVLRWKLEPLVMCKIVGGESSLIELIPDVTSVAHLAEMRGRRQAVGRSLLPLKTFFEDVVGSRATDEAFIASTWLSKFIQSPWFLDPYTYLPIDTGHGEGFDQRPKFIQWMIQAGMLHTSAGETRHRNTAYTQLIEMFLKSRPGLQGGYFRNFGTDTVTAIVRSVAGALQSDRICLSDGRLKTMINLDIIVVGFQQRASASVFLKLV